MKTTTNYGLQKPDPASDNVDITIINANMDTLDAAVASKETPSGAQTKATAAQTAAQTYADSKIAALVNSSPAALDTLKELADAMGDDPNFRTTILNAIAAKANSTDLTTVSNNLTSHEADYVRQPGYAVDTGATNHLIVSLNPAPVAYVDGMGIVVKVANTNTGAMDINSNSLGVMSVKNPDGTVLSAGDLTAGGIYSLKYNSSTSNFILVGKGGALASGVVITPSNVDQAIPKNRYDGTTSSGKVAAVTFNTAKVLNDTTIAGTTGTMVSYPYDQQATSSSTDGSGILRFKIPKGGYITEGGFGAGYTSIKIVDSDFIAPNIPKGKTVLGLAGSAIRAIKGQFSSTSTNDASYTISGVGFQPDMVIVFQNDNYYPHALFNTLTNASNGVAVSNSGGIGVDADSVNSNGFTIHAYSSYVGATMTWIAIKF